MTNAEEVAFNDDSLPSGKSEEMVLNWHLSRLVKHGRLSAFQRFVQQVFDGFAVKYMASAVALLLYAAPLYFKDPSMRGSQDDLTQVPISHPVITGPSCATQLGAVRVQVCCIDMPSPRLQCVHLSLAFSYAGLHPGDAAAAEHFQVWYCPRRDQGVFIITSACLNSV